MIEEWLEEEKWHNHSMELNMRRQLYGPYLKMLDLLCYNQ